MSPLGIYSEKPMVAKSGIRVVECQYFLPQWADILLCWEKQKSPPDVLTQNPGIRRLPRMVDFKSFYGIMRYPEWVR